MCIYIYIYIYTMVRNPVKAALNTACLLPLPEPLILRSLKTNIVYHHIIEYNISQHVISYYNIVYHMIVEYSISIATMMGRGSALDMA